MKACIRSFPCQRGVHNSWKYILCCIVVLWICKNLSLKHRGNPVSAERKQRKRDWRVQNSSTLIPDEFKYLENRKVNSLIPFITFLATVTIKFSGFLLLWFATRILGCIRRAWPAGWRRGFCPSAPLWWDPPRSPASSSGALSKGQTWTCWSGAREGHKSDLRAGAPLLRGKAERAGSVQAGEEEGPGWPYCGLSVLKGGFQERWGQTF